MRNEHGFSVIEVMIAVGLFAVCISSLASTCYRFLGMNTKMEQRIAAQSVAQDLLEGYRQQDPSALPSTGTTKTTIVKGSRSFDTTTQYCSNASYCTTSSRQLTVSVSFRGATMVSMTTVFTALR